MLLPVADFYKSNNDLGEDEQTFVQLFEAKGRPDLAAIVRNGRLQHRFAFCCGYNLGFDWDGFLGLFRGLRDAVGDGAGLDWDEWKAHAMERYVSDEGFQFLVSREKNSA